MTGWKLRELPSFTTPDYTTMQPFTRHPHDPARGTTAGFVVREQPKTAPRLDDAAKVCYNASPYLLDLGWHAERRRAERETVEQERRDRARKRIGLRLLLDERIHLRDIRSRSLSVNPPGWSDFPPPNARSLPHAVAIVITRFFEEHPLADLTILSLVHLSALLIARAVVEPVASVLRRDTRVLSAHPRFVLHRDTSTTKTSVHTTGSKAAPIAVSTATTSRAAAATMNVHAAPTLTTISTNTSPLASIAPPTITTAPAIAPVAATTTATATMAATSARAPRVPASERFAAFRRQFANAWQRPTLGFAMAAAASFAVPIGLHGTFTDLLQSRDVIVEHGVDGARSLQAAVALGRDLDFAGANAEFTAAAERFRDARERLGVVGRAVTVAASALPTDHPLASVHPLLTVGREVALGGAVMTRGMDALGSDRAPVEKLRILREHLDAAIPHLARATAALDNVSPAALPDDYAALANLARTELPAALDVLSELVASAELAETLLGSEQKMRYLVVFQNDRELRPTGGFIGSFALLDLDHGSVAGLDMPGGGSYDLQGSLRERVIAPHPMRLINPRWEFQDGNWSPDFPTSAQRLTWFYGQSGGPTIDGVIAINASLMERLLAALGPVDMPEYDMVINADNFYIETQTEVEIGYDREANQPKQFLADLAPRIVERAMEADSATLLAIADALRGAMRTKDVQVWLRDSDLQERAHGRGWSGAFPAPTSGDFLAIVHTNIAGQKTDKVMEESVDRTVKILPDGSATVSLTISRTHHGTKGEPFSGVRNVDYLRVYVPHGATLVDADGFAAPDPKLMKLPSGDERPDPELAEREASMRIHYASGTETYDELGRTVFGNWVMTDPGQTSVVSLTYRLPTGTILHDGDGFTYKLAVIRQSGANAPAFISRVEYPRVWFPTDSEPATTANDGNLIWTNILNEDWTIRATFRPR